MTWNAHALIKFKGKIITLIIKTGPIDCEFADKIENYCILFRYFVNNFGILKKLTVSTNLIQRHLFEMSYLFKKCSKLNLPENCVIAAYGNPRLPFQKIYHRQTKKVEKNTP